MLKLELKIPPLVLVIASAALMRIASTYFPLLRFEFPFHRTVSWVFFLLGLFVCTLGALEFHRAHTTLNPMKPQLSSSLVTSGIYRLTRNPMYLGFLLFLIGWAATTPCVGTFLVLPLFVLYLTQFQIKPEERELNSICGDSFREYCATVRRWI